jgi:hypothetical protein
MRKLPHILIPKFRDCIRDQQASRSFGNSALPPISISLPDRSGAYILGTVLVRRRVLRISTIMNICFSIQIFSIVVC